MGVRWGVVGAFLVGVLGGALEALLTGVLEAGALTGVLVALVALAVLPLSFIVVLILNSSSSSSSS